MKRNPVAGSLAYTALGDCADAYPRHQLGSSRPKPDLRITSRFPVTYVDEPLVVKYGGHEDQLSRQFWGMDRFRIRALEKVLQEGVLNEAQRIAARQTMLEKLDVYIAGARKRGKSEEVAIYEEKRRTWNAA